MRHLRDAEHETRATTKPSGFRVPRPASRVSSSGFSLVAALFLIVVVAALGAFAVRIGASQQQTANLALLTARALAAANSGIEYGAYQALKPVSSCVSATLNLTEGGLNGFTVNVTCSVTTHTESSATPNVNIYRIDATASAGIYGMPDYVSRHVYATFASVP
jgi:MSHA biogenesis protein MshP